MSIIRKWYSIDVYLGRITYEFLFKYLAFLNRKAPKILPDDGTGGGVMVTADMVESLIYSSLPYPTNMKSVFQAIQLAIGGFPETLVDLNTEINNSNIIGKMAVLCADLDRSVTYSLAEWENKMKDLEDISSVGSNILSSHLLIW
jgi:hypothetical protein